MLLLSEMQWAMLFFQNKVDYWVQRCVSASAGERCYALRQAVTWRHFTHLVEKALIAANSK